MWYYSKQWFDVHRLDVHIGFEASQLSSMTMFELRLDHPVGGPIFGTEPPVGIIAWTGHSVLTSSTRHSFLALRTVDPGTDQSMLRWSTLLQTTRA